MASDLITKLTDIKTYKDKLRESLNNKFGTNFILSEDTFESYSGKIDQLLYVPYTDDKTPVVKGTFGKNGTKGLTAGNMMYYNGDFKAYRVMNAVWNDYAEFFESEGEWEYGDIIELNPKTKKYRKASTEDSPLVVGVASNTFGSIVGGSYATIEENLKHFIPIGLMGRVNVKIKGAIKAGDLISVSDESGIGKKADGKVGTIIGKALASSDLEYNLIPMLILRG